MMIDLEKLHNLTMYEIGDMISDEEAEELKQIISSDIHAYLYWSYLKDTMTPSLSFAEQCIRENPPEQIIRKVETKLRKKKKLRYAIGIVILMIVAICSIAYARSYGF